MCKISIDKFDRKCCYRDCLLYNFKSVWIDVKSNIVSYAYIYNKIGKKSKI